MRADNTHNLIVAARTRRERTLARAHTALDRAASSGQLITVTELAQQAGVSRSWLYAEASLRDRLDALRRDQPPRRHAHPAAPEPASDASMRTRLEAALEKNKRLARDNQRLRDQLAQALGQQRHARITTGRVPHST